VNKFSLNERDSTPVELETNYSAKARPLFSLSFDRHLPFRRSRVGPPILFQGRRNEIDRGEHVRYVYTAKSLKAVDGPAISTTIELVLARGKQRAMEEKLEATAESKPMVAVQKKKKGKKRKISKHIAEAAATKKQQADETTATTDAGGTPKITANKAEASPNKKKRKSATSIVKDPAEAGAYLISWQKHQKDASSSAWKFSKNTQSWLIRHMYEADKVSKGNFAVLLDYIKSGDKNTIQRCLEEATRRALRYQQSSSHEQKDEESDSKNKNKKEDEKERSKNKSDGSATAQEVNGVDEEVRWNKLDEHDKRKEYKRARKVLDTLS